MFGFLIPDWLKIGAGVAAGALLISPGVYLYGKHEGRQAAAVEALERSVEILRERETIDDEVSVADALALCADFRLPDDDEAECVRRLSGASSEP